MNMYVNMVVKENVMKKTSTLFILSIMIIILFSLCGCNILIDSLTTKEETQEQLVVIWGRDGDTYKYSDKIELFMSNSSIDKTDLFFIKDYNDDACWREILSGDFEKAAWNDYKLFIKMEGTYYMFDINAYEVPQEEYAEPEYELKEYSEKEMKEMYPNYESFNWYD